MTTRIGGSRKKTRSIMAVAKKQRGKLSISRFFQKLKEGDKVVFKAAPAIHKGMYDRRVHGRTGTVKRVIGKVVEVQVRDRSKIKTILVNPVHLKKV